MVAQKSFKEKALSRQHTKIIRAINETNRRSKPRFDKQFRTFWFGPVMVKEFRVPAQNQILILEAFQEQNWPVHIDDPLLHENGINPKKRLKDAIWRLNHNQLRPLIKFHANGEGRGIRWERLA